MEARDGGSGIAVISAASGGGQEVELYRHYVSLDAQHSAVTARRGLRDIPVQSPHCMDGKARIQKDKVSLKIYTVSLFP